MARAALVFLAAALFLGMTLAAHHDFDEAEEMDFDSHIQVSQRRLQQKPFKFFGRKCAKKVPNCAFCLPGFKGCAICDKGYMTQRFTNRCISSALCDYGCRRCDRFTGKCTACFSKYYLIKGGCKTCQDLRPNCKTCGPDRKCSICNTDFVPVNGSCTARALLDPFCDTFNYNGTCKVCNVGFEIDEEGMCAFQPIFLSTADLFAELNPGDAVLNGTGNANWVNLFVNPASGKPVASNDPEVPVSSLQIFKDVNLTQVLTFSIGDLYFSGEFTSNYTVTVKGLRQGTEIASVDFKFENNARQVLNAVGMFDKIDTLTFTISPATEMFMFSGLTYAEGSLAGLITDQDDDTIVEDDVAE